ncbi:hypothetical protein 14_00008 [Pseudomonas phage Epa14]|uniref:Uncharacterized protein n=1 Tax=Pseudomonas phage Epa14 TaxID=2719186 RepID=A0A6G9LJW5_9CAUD|nr:tail length tape measure protein [Pseudomonas phage Epa14]QIQ64904.1 hypothetical protein 14_00008 [Pseudomonas phage Epa14]
MSSIVYFQYITGTIQVPLEVEVEAGQLQMVNVEVDPDGFRKFWPIADSLLWDAEECKFRPRYETHYMGEAVKHADQAMLAFAAGQYYLRMESKEERKDPDADLHASELSAMRETCRKAKVEKHRWCAKILVLTNAFRTPSLAKTRLRKEIASFISESRIWRPS